MGRALRAFAALALGLGAALAFAQTEADAELKRLEVALGRINQAQQSVYQQFQMVQELRRAELRGRIHSRRSQATSRRRRAITTTSSASARRARRGSRT